MGRKLNTFINCLITEIGNLLETDYCFEAHGSRVWLRKHGWRTDWFGINKRMSDFVFFMQTIIPPEDSGKFDYCQLGIANVLFTKHSKAFINYPSLCFMYNKFRKDVLDGIRQGVSWYGNFDTVEKCIEYTKENAFNLESPASKYIFRVLDALASGKDPSDVFTLDNDVLRELFDVNHVHEKTAIEREDDVEL